MDRRTLETYIRKHHRPVLLVIASDGAEAIARKSGLTINDLLRPFLTLKDISIPFRTATNVFTITDFSLRIITPNELQFLSFETMENTLQRSVTTTVSDSSSSSPTKNNPYGFSDATLGSPEEAARWFTKTQRSSNVSPWYTQYRDDLGRILRCLPHDQFDAPCAILGVTSTLDTNPGQLLRDMLNINALPDSFKGQFDPDIPKFCCLLHDASSSTNTDKLFFYSNETIVAATTSAPVSSNDSSSSSVSSPILPPNVPLPVPYTSPYHGKAPLDPSLAMRDLRTQFPPSQVFGIAINSDSTGLGGGSSTNNNNNAAIFEQQMEEPIVYWPKGLSLPPIVQSFVTSSSSTSNPKYPNVPKLPVNSATPVPMTTVLTLAAMANNGTIGTTSVGETLLQHAVYPRRGCCLTNDDINALRGVITRIILEGVLPALESRMYTLQQMVSKMKGGLRNKVMSWLGSGSSTSGTSSNTVQGRSIITNSGNNASSGGPATGTIVGNGEDAVLVGDVTTVLYPYGSPEASTRVLADLAFSIGDYDTALSAYRSVRDDYKADKAASYYASACEAMAFCYIMKGDTFTSNQGARDTESLLETAIIWYYKAAQAAISNQVSSTATSAVASLINASVNSTNNNSLGFASPNVNSYDTTNVLNPAGASNVNVLPTTLSQIAKKLAIRLATRACAISADITFITAVATLPQGFPASAAIHMLPSTATSTIGAVNTRLREVTAMLRRTGQAEGDGTLASALMTEQAAYACLRSVPPYYRRAGYHLATAGQLYAIYASSTMNTNPLAIHHARHAVRCLSAALTVYASAGGNSGNGGNSLSSWSLISDHLSLQLAQQLGVLGDPGTATGYLSRLLAYGAYRLPPNSQRLILREFARVYTAWCEKRLGEAVKRIGTGAIKKGTLPSTTDITTLTVQQLGSEDNIAALNETNKATELLNSGLPLVDNASLQIVSWSNGWTAAIATVQAWNGCQGDTSAKAIPNSTNKLTNTNNDSTGSVVVPCNDCTVPTLASLLTNSVLSKFYATDSSILLPMNQYLAEIGSGDGTVPGEGVWDGYLPGEGPVRETESASNVGRGAWMRISEALLRDIKLRDKLGNTIFTTGNQRLTNTANPLSRNTSNIDWKKVCKDIAIGQEDEAELNAKNHKALAPNTLLLKSSNDYDDDGIEEEDDDTEIVDEEDSLNPPNKQSTMNFNVSDGIDIANDTLSLPTGPIASRLIASSPSVPVSSLALTTHGSNGSFLRSTTLPGSNPLPSAGSSVPHSSGIRTKHAYHPADIVNKATERYAGEPLAVIVALTNPLGVEMPLTGVRLLAEYKDGGVSPAENKLTGETIWIQTNTTVNDSTTVSSSGLNMATVPSDTGVCTWQNISYLPIDITLNPGETRHVHLMLRPLVPGTLIIKGLVWTLGGLVRCRHEFELKGPPLNDNRNNRANSARAVDKRLEAKLKPSREWGAVRLTGFHTETGNILPGMTNSTVSVLASLPSPSSSTPNTSGGGPPIVPGPPLPIHLPIASSAVMYDGEIRECTLEFTNIGSVPVSTILAQPQPSIGSRIQITLPNGQLDGIDGSTIILPLTDACITNTSGQTVSTPGSSLKDDSTASSSTLTVLEPGHTASWKVFIRGNRPGTHALRIAFYYGNVSNSNSSGSGSTPSTPSTPISPSVASNTNGTGVHPSIPSNFPLTITTRTLSTLRVIRWCTRVRIFPSLAIRSTLLPSTRIAGEYELRVGITHIGGYPNVIMMNSTGTSTNTSGNTNRSTITNTTGVSGTPYVATTASLVPSSITIENISCISDYWKGDLIRIESSSQLSDRPLSLTGLTYLLANNNNGSNNGNETNTLLSNENISVDNTPSKKKYGQELSYCEARVYVYRITSVLPQPTRLYANDGTIVNVSSADVTTNTLSLVPQKITDSSSSSSNENFNWLSILTGTDRLLSKEDISLLRLSYAHHAIMGTISYARRKEHERRRAAEAVDALPPTLRSIRVSKQQNTGGNDNETVVEDNLLPSLPSTINAALCNGRSHISFTVSWSRSIAADPNHGTVPTSRGQFFCHKLPVNTDTVKGSIGVVPTWLAKDINKLAMITLAKNPSLNTPVGQLNTTTVTPVVGGGTNPNPSTGLVANRTTMGTTNTKTNVPIKGSVIPLNPSMNLSLPSSIPLLATLELPHSITLTTSPQYVSGYLVLYHAGGNTYTTNDDEDDEVNCHILLKSSNSLVSSSLSNSTAVKPPLPLTSIQWLGTTNHYIQHLRPGHRIILPVTIMVQECGTYDLSSLIWLHIPSSSVNSSTVQGYKLFRNSLILKITK